MRSLNLKEFAQQLRMEGNEFADEILDLLVLEEEVADPYSEICDDLAHYAPSRALEPARAVEWLGDRSDLLAEIENHLSEAGREPEGTQDAGDVVKELLGTLGDAEDILEAAGWPGDGDFIAGIQALADRPAPMEFDL